MPNANKTLVVLSVATVLAAGANETAFQTSLRDAPNNGWALHGLAEMYRRQGRAQAEVEVRGRLAGTWAGGPPELARL